MCTEWIGIPSISPPRAPGVITVVVGSSAQSLDAAAMRCAVSAAVPDGASIFWLWCSSMISAVSKNGAAISANRIINTAPTAKFGTIAAFAVDASNNSANSASSSSVNPVVPTTACTPCAAAPTDVLARRASSTVKSTATWAPATSS